MRRFLRRTSSRTLVNPTLVLVLCGVIAGFAVPVAAQSGEVLARGSHVVTLGVRPITVLATSGDPLPLIALSGGRAQTDVSTFYSLTSNVENVLIEAVLDHALPAGTHLQVALSSTLGRSHRWTDLSSGLASAVLVSSMRRGLENGQSIAYRLTVDDDVDSLELQSRTVSLTLRDPVSGSAHTVHQVVTIGLFAPNSALDTSSAE